MKLVALVIVCACRPPIKRHFAYTNTHTQKRSTECLLRYAKMRKNINSFMMSISRMKSLFYGLFPSIFSWRNKKSVMCTVAQNRTSEFMSDLLYYHQKKIECLSRVINKDSEWILEIPSSLAFDALRYHEIAIII